MRRGFGCLFGLFFLAVLVTVVALTSVVLSAVGVFGAGHPFFQPAAAVVFLILAVVFFGAVNDWEGGAWSLGIIPFLIGLGYLLVWRLDVHKDASPKV